jgi:DNA-binding response OmpR family regulator
MDIPLRIGVVEDNDDLRASLVEVLQARGHAVVAYPSAEDLDGSPRAGTFELMLLDLNLPGEDGLSLAKRLKHSQPSLRVIMLTTRIALADRVNGYDAGADLYLPKPISVDELLAAVRAISRQISASLRSEAAPTEGLVRLDTRKLSLQSAKGLVSLNRVDLTLLTSLARAPGQRLEHWQLIEAMDLEVGDAALANLPVQISRLRRKLTQLGCPGDALRSLRASGYQLCITLEIC